MTVATTRSVRTTGSASSGLHLSSIAQARPTRCTSTCGGKVSTSPPTPAPTAITGPYHGRERFNVLSETQFHNTVTVDGVSQMERASPFLWLPWLSGDVVANETLDGGAVHYWEGRHDGYERLDDPVSHRRAIVRLGGDHWLVLDRLEGQRAHDYRLQWLLTDLPYTADDAQASRRRSSSPRHTVSIRLRLGSSQPGPPVSLVRADPKSPRGWRSPYYMAMEPALSVVQERRTASVWFWTSSPRAR